MSMKFRTGFNILSQFDLVIPIIPLNFVVKTGAMLFSTITFAILCRFLPRGAAMLARSWDRNTVCPSVCLSVRLSVRLSDTRVLCDETIESTADILIPHERVIILVF